MHAKLYTILFSVLTFFIGYSHSLKKLPSKYTDKFTNEIFSTCPRVNTQKIGIVYLALPLNEDVLHNMKLSSRERLLSTFQLNNFYTLTMLSRLFQVSTTDRLLFFHINDFMKNVTNHYNRWFTDEFWSSKIPLDNLKFIKINYNLMHNQTRINYYLILQKLINEAKHYFDKPKTHILFVSGDTIIGPKILSCFSLDLSVPTSYVSELNLANSQRFNYGFDCYNALHTRKTKTFTYYSFLYAFKGLHQSNEISGMFIWKANTNFSLSLVDKNASDDQIEFAYEGNVPSGTNSTEIQMNSDSLVNQRNIQKFIYKDEIHKSEYKINFEDAYGVFGYEFNKIEAPNLENVLSSENYLYTILRNIFYNQSKPFSQKTLTTPIIPNLVHLIWFGEPYKPLKFIDYLSLKSIIVNIKPDKIKIHGDIEPYGELWESIRNHSKIEWVHRDRPLYRYGQNFTNAPIQHLADIARLEVMYEEGGLYSDTDILWVKQIDQLRYIDTELIASNDITSYCFEFPNNIQIGAFLAPPKSNFLLKWLESYKEYYMHPNDYTAISMCEPYKLYEKMPDKVYINNRLQMIYFNGWSMFIPRFIHHSAIHDYNANIDWLNNGTHGYHLPRHGQLFTLDQFKMADKSSVPIQIATHIYELPFEN